MSDLIFLQVVTCVLFVCHRRDGNTLPRSAVWWLRMSEKKIIQNFEPTLCHYWEPTSMIYQI